MPRFATASFKEAYEKHCRNILRYPVQEETVIRKFIRENPLMLLGCLAPDAEEGAPQLFLSMFQEINPRTNILEAMQEALALLFNSDTFPYSIDNLIINMYNNIFNDSEYARASELDDIHRLAPAKVCEFYLWLLISQPTLLNCLFSDGKSLIETASPFFESTPEVIKDIKIYYKAQQQAQHGSSSSLRCVNILTEQLTDGARSLPELIARHFGLGVNNVWLNPIDLSSTVTWSRTADYRTPVSAEAVTDSKYARSSDEIIDPLFVRHERTRESLNRIHLLEDKYKDEGNQLPRLAPCINHGNTRISRLARDVSIRALTEHIVYCDQLSDASRIAFNITKLYSRPQMSHHRTEMSQHVLQHIGLSDATIYLKEITSSILSIPMIKIVTDELSRLPNQGDIKKYLNLALSKIKKSNYIITGSGDTLRIDPDIAGLIDAIKKCPQTLRLLFGNKSYSSLCDFAAYLPRIIKFASDRGISSQDLNLRIKASKILEPVSNIVDYFNSNKTIIFRMTNVISEISKLEILKTRASNYSKIFSIECQQAIWAATLTEEWVFAAPKKQEKVGRLEMLQAITDNLHGIIAVPAHTPAKIQERLSEIFTTARTRSHAIFHSEIDTAIGGLKNSISANAKLVFSAAENTNSHICNPQTWGNHTLLEGQYLCPTNLRSSFFTSEAINIARRTREEALYLITSLSDDAHVEVSSNVFALVETNISRGQRSIMLARLIELDDFTSPLLVKEDVSYEHSMLSQLDREHTELCRLKSEDDQVIRCVTNMAKCMGIGIMFDLVANHVSTKHPLVTDAPHLFCSKGSGTSFVDAIAFNFYRPELGDEFVNTFVNDTGAVIEKYGQLLNAEISKVLSEFVYRKMKLLGFSGARVDCVRNIPSQIRQDMYRVIMEHSDPTNAHIMEELLFCGRPQVEIPRWRPSGTPLAHTVTGISFFKERGWDGQVHRDVLDDADMKMMGVRSGVINTVSNHDHDTALNRVIGRTAMELMSHKHYANSLGTVVQILLFNADVEQLREANLLRGCDLDKLRNLYDMMHPEAIGQDEALRDRLISILTFGQCTEMIKAMDDGCLQTQSFVLRRLLNHIYTNALSGSAGYYYVNGDDFAKLAINSIFTRADGSPIQSSIVLDIFNGTLKTESRYEQLISYTASLFVDMHVNRFLGKPMISYDSKKVRGYRDRRGRPLQNISYLDVLSVLDAKGKESLLASMKQFVINTISANIEYFLRCGHTAIDLVDLDGNDEINIQSLFSFVKSRLLESKLPLEDDIQITIANTLLKTTPLEDTYFQSRSLSEYLDAYNIFPTINSIIRSYTGFSGTPNLHSFQINDSIVAFLKFDGGVPLGKLEIIICSLNPGVTYSVDATDMKHLAVWLQKRYFSDRHDIESWEDFARDHMGDTEFTHVFDAIMSPTSLPGSDSREVIVHLTPGVNQGFEQEGYRFVKYDLDLHKLVKILIARTDGLEFLEVLESARAVALPALSSLPPNGLTTARAELLSERALADKFAQSPSLEISIHNPRDVDVLLELRGSGPLPCRHKGFEQLTDLDILLTNRMHSLEVRRHHLLFPSHKPVIAFPSTPTVEADAVVARCRESRREADELSRQHSVDIMLHSLRRMRAEARFVSICSAKKSTSEETAPTVDPTTWLFV